MGRSETLGTNCGSQDLTMGHLRETEGQHENLFLLLGPEPPPHFMHVVYACLLMQTAYVVPVWDKELVFL